jgi:gliding motility-associated-like protein
MKDIYGVYGKNTQMFHTHTLIAPKRPRKDNGNPVSHTPKIIHMIKKVPFLSIILFLLTSTFSFSQLTNQFYFYKGDTLDGFDVNACFREAQQTRIDLRDLKGYMKQKEMAFVNQKYHFVTRKSSPFIPVITSTCNNLDFEAGTMAGWTGKVGENDNSTLPIAVTTAGFQTLGPNSAETSCSYTTLVNAGIDPWGSFPMVDPGGGTWACRLGGENCNYNGPCNTPFSGSSPGESIQQTFLVTAANAMLTYNYAVVLEQPSNGHSLTQCPYFKAELLDAAGDTIPCMQYYVEAGSSGTPPGMLVSPTQHFGDNMFYSVWRSNSMNLKNYISQNVTVRFTAAGCTLGGHTGYAYVDAFCSPIQVLASSAEVCQGGTLNLTSPPVGQGGTYAWSTVPPGGPGIVGSSTGQTVTLNANGTYEVTVTARPGCFYKIDTLISFYPLPTPVATATPTICGSSTGTTNVTSATGNTPFTYSWNSTPVQTTATATGLPAGTYSVTLTTTNGCAATTTATVTAPSAPTASIVNTPVSCFGGADGTATVTAAVGSPAYTYSWNPAPASGTTVAATGLTIGTYTCTVTDSKSCSVTATTTITQPTALAATNTQVNELCNGGTNGSMAVTVTGGTATYTYSWNPAPATGTAATATALSAGAYTCSITDSKGCATTTTATLTEPTPLVTTASNTPALCAASNGTATVTPSGATPPYTYSWNTTPAQTTATATALPAGTFTCTIKDNNGCTITGITTVTTNGGPTVTPGVVTNVSCFGLCDGTASVNATGGTAPLTYSWSPAGGTASSATALCANTYTCTVTDATGCANSTTLVITQPTALVAGASGTNVSCFGLTDGTAKGTASGGTPLYTYSWSPTPGGGQGSVNATGLGAGTYTFTLTDANGCVTTAPVTITQPPILAMTAAGVDATCFGKCNGQLICIPTGGTPSYTYSWSTGCAAASCNGICVGTYTSTVTDAHGCVITATASVSQPTAITLSMFPVPAHCNHSDGADSVFATGGTSGYTYTWTPVVAAVPNGAAGYHNIPAGNYTVMVHDAHGCADSSNNVVPNLPGVNISVVSFVNVTCFGGHDGSITVIGNGGFPAYTYSWSPAPGGGQNSATATGLSAGTYTCTITDAAGCTNLVSSPIMQPPQLILTPGPPVTICIGQCTDLTATATGGSPAYTFSWTQNGTALPSTHVCPLVTTIYTVTCTDSHGCVTGPATVTITVFPPLEVVTANAANICPGGSDTLHATGSGGNGTYFYNWSPAAGLSSTTVQNPVATPAVTTTYMVIVSDNCGTPTDSAFVTVTLWPPPAVTFTTTDTVGCAPMCANFAGASNPACASAVWTFGDGSTGTGCAGARHCYTQAGTYNVTYAVTDIHGCIGSLMIPNFINAYPVPVAAFTDSPNPASILNPEISFTDLSSGETSWLWNFGDFSGASSTLENPKYTYPDTGCYTITLTVLNSFGCKAVATGPICIEPDFTFYAPNTFTPNADGKNDTWSPKGIGIDPNHYDLIMFDRWGNLMWETHVWGEGWDGRANDGNDIAQIDTYIWKVVLLDFRGNKHQYMGHCNIIK